MNVKYRDAQSRRNVIKMSFRSRIVLPSELIVFFFMDSLASDEEAIFSIDFPWHLTQIFWSFPANNAPLKDSLALPSDRFPDGRIGA
jgi:hypothetical protein